MKKDFINYNRLYYLIIFFSFFFGNILVAYCADGKSENSGANNNLVTNPSMEQEINGLPSGWKTKIIKIGPQFVWDSNESRSGRYSLKIQGPGSGCWYTTVPVRFGKKYRISFYFKARSEKEYNPDANLYAIVWRIDSKGIRRPVQWINDFRLRTYKDWTKVTIVDYIAREGDKEIIFELWLNGQRKEVSSTDNSSVWFDDAVIEEIDCPSVKKPCSLIHKDNNFSLWSTNAVSSVYKSELLPEEATKDFKISLRGARGQQEAFQLVVRPETAWKNVTWEWADFAGPSFFSKDKMKSFRVEYISRPETDSDLKDYVRGGMVPDPIPPEPRSTLWENQNNPFFFVVHIPYHVKAGIYTTKVRLKNDGKIVATVPIEVKIWNFALPQKPTFEMMSSLWPGIIYHYETGNENEILKRYLKNLFEHRAVTDVGRFSCKIIEEKNRTLTIMTNTGPFLRKENRNGTKHISLDTKGFDDLIAYQRENGGCNNLDIHWSNFKLNTAFGVPLFLDKMNKEFNPEFVRLFRELLGQLNACLERQGCYSSFKVQIGDEPHILDKAQVNFYTNIAKLFKTIDPRIRTYTNGQFLLDFLPYYDHWNFIHLLAPFSQREMNLMRKHNKSVGIYLNNMTNPSMPPIKLRLLLWALWKENYKGLLWWQINGWGQTVTRVDAHGKRSSFFEKMNPWQGRTKGVVFIYPPREGKNETGPINSLRWEALRQGLEDVEYLNMLERLIKDKKGTIPEDRLLAAKKALDRINEVVSHVPYGGMVDNDQFNTYDTSLVEEVRAQIAENIDALLHSK